jgi:hypothetical protein
MLFCMTHGLGKTAAEEDMMRVRIAGLLGMMGVLALSGHSQAATRDVVPAVGYADVLMPGPNGHVVAPLGSGQAQPTATAHAMTVQYRYDRYHHRHWHRPYRHYEHRRHSVRIGPVVIR